MAEIVYEEIIRTDDDLSKWLKSSKIPIKKIDEQVTKCLKGIYSADPNHRYLVDNTKARSLADPWVIAHACTKRERSCCDKGRKSYSIKFYKN
jgi:hypothetical protein